MAITRARQLLFLCHSRQDDHSQGLSPSRYLSHIPAELRRVQDECVKVVMVGAGARTREMNVWLSAMGPASGAFMSASSRGRNSQLSGRTRSGERRSAAGVTREAVVGGGPARKAVASGWTTAARVTAGEENDRSARQVLASSMPFGGAADGVCVGFQRASSSSFKREEDESVQIEQE